MQIIYPNSENYLWCYARFTIMCAEENNPHALLPDTIINVMITMYNSYAHPVRDAIVFFKKGKGVYDIQICYPIVNIVFLRLNIPIQ